VAVRIVEALAILLAGTGVVVVLVARRRRPRRADPADGLLASGRRVFLNRVMLGSLAIFGMTLFGGSIATLWPVDRRGSKVVAGKRDDLLFQIHFYGHPVYNIEGRFYIVKYDITEPNNTYVRAGVVAGGLMALSQKCSHLGCRVPFCSTSQWFECPCHGAQFNMAGEVRRGPAPAGMWRFPITVTSDGTVIVDTTQRIAQPPAGTDTTHQQPMGAFCVPN